MRKLIIPDKIIDKWQGIVDLLAEMFKVPAALIMKAEPPEIVVFVSSRSEGNPYGRGDRERLDIGLYCETVMKKREMLLVPNALKDDIWRSGPNVKKGMIFYMGFPVRLPDGEIFGTICVMDVKGNAYGETYRRLLRRFRDVIESDLEYLVETEDRLEEEKRLSDMERSRRDNIRLLEESERSRRALLSILEDVKLAKEEIDRSLSEKEALLKEVHHRVKNNMQVISSLLSLQARRIKDEEGLEVLRESRNRIRSMALVHEKLYRADDMAHVNFGEYIDKLASGLFSSYKIKPSDIRLRKEIEDVSLGVDTAVPCGLILNELVSNALKHAFPEGKIGEIRIGLRRTGDNGVELVISDNGIGMPEDVDPGDEKTLGLQLVNTLVKQLQGELELTRGNGTEFRIKIEG